LQSGGGLDLVLETLVQLRWITEVEGKYRISEEGARIRQAAEDTTNCLFDAPWTVLIKTEMTELESLVRDFATSVAPPDNETQLK